MCFDSFVKVSDFDFQLPPGHIARHPLTNRDQSKLMLLRRDTGAISHHLFSEFPDLLQDSDIVVLNNTRVFPARLLGQRLGLTAAEGKGVTCSARIEVLLTKQVEEKVWEALVKPGRKLRIGERVRFGNGELEGTVLERGLRGIRKFRFEYEGNFEVLVDRLGHIPLPPYLSRPDTAEDRNRYQTVFAKKRGAVAAPTAGLHFTPAVFDRLSAKGIQWQEITLHVGLGTFQPVGSETVEEHRMEPESLEVTPGTANMIQSAISARRRIIAVGTTVARTLEFIALRHDGQIVPESGETNLFIYPGFTFRCVNGLLTNFHLPRSTLLMLVSAFAGQELIREAYRQAILLGYRFYSYGDCMLIL
jgi:S-adenosylmethionine:tRNA ribosyltransferase-isomerase